MASNIKRIKNGIKLIPTTTAVDEEGEIRADSATNKLAMHNGTSESAIVTENHAATLTNKTIDGASNTITGIDSSGVTVTPSGNLGSTDVQAALEELQTDIDTSGGDLSTHTAASSGVHGVTGSVVGTTDTQTLSGKTMAQDLLPDANNTRDVGANANRWKDAYFSGSVDIDTDLVVDGDLTVNGTTVTLNTATLDVEDVNISVNVGGNQVSADDSAGLTIEMSDATNVTLIYDKDVPSRWKAGDLGSEIELANISSTQTLTNKTIDGNSNTLTVLAASQLSGATPIANGGTGQTTATAGFDALSPTTTKGDVIVNNGTNNVRVGVGSNGQVLTANSAVAAGVEWSAASGSSDEYAWVKDRVSDATDGGTFTAGAWQTRVLGTLDNPGSYSWISIGSNQITLDAGTYIIEWSAPAFFVDGHQTRLRNITDASTAAVGSREWTASSDSQQTRSTGTTQVTIASSKAFEIQHRCGTTRATDGFGRSNLDSFGEQIEYTQVKIIKR